MLIQTHCQFYCSKQKFFVHSILHLVFSKVQTFVSFCQFFCQSFLYYNCLFVHNNTLILLQGYSVLNYANKEIEQGNYEKAYTYLKQAIQNQKDKNQEIVDIATNKQNEINQIVSL